MTTYTFTDQHMEALIKKIDETDIFSKIVNYKPPLILEEQDLNGPGMLQPLICWSPDSHNALEHIHSLVKPHNGSRLNKSAIKMRLTHHFLELTPRGFFIKESGASWSNALPNFVLERLIRRINQGLCYQLFYYKDPTRKPQGFFRGGLQKCTVIAQISSTYIDKEECGRVFSYGPDFHSCNTGKWVLNPTVDEILQQSIDKSGYMGIRVKPELFSDNWETFLFEGINDVLKTYYL